MLQIKDFRDRYGISQRELALLLGASLQQVKRSEVTGAWPNGRLFDLYRLQKNLFYQQGQLPPTPNNQEPEQPENIRQNLQEIKEECFFLIRRHERNLSKLTLIYQQTRQFYSVLMLFIESLTDAEEEHLSGLKYLDSLLLKKLGRSGPVEQLKISIRIKSLQKQIESVDDILNGKI